MPPDGDMTVTISEETATKLFRVMARHDVGTMAITIDDTAQLVVDGELMTITEHVRLVSHRL